LAWRSLAWQDYALSLKRYPLFQIESDGAKTSSSLCCRAGTSRGIRLQSTRWQKSAGVENVRERRTDDRENAKEQKRHMLNIILVSCNTLRTNKNRTKGAGMFRFRCRYFRIVIMYEVVVQRNTVQLDALTSSSRSCLKFAFFQLVCQPKLEYSIRYHRSLCFPL